MINLVFNQSLILIKVTAYPVKKIYINNSEDLYVIKFKFQLNQFNYCDIITKKSNENRVASRL